MSPNNPGSKMARILSKVAQCHRLRPNRSILQSLQKLEALNRRRKIRSRSHFTSKSAASKTKSHTKTNSCIARNSRESISLTKCPPITPSHSRTTAELCPKTTRSKSRRSCAELSSRRAAVLMVTRVPLLMVSMSCRRRSMCRQGIRPSCASSSMRTHTAPMEIAANLFTRRS